MTTESITRQTCDVCGTEHEIRDGEPDAVAQVSIRQPEPMRVASGIDLTLDVDACHDCAQRIGVGVRLMRDCKDCRIRLSAAINSLCPHAGAKLSTTAKGFSPPPQRLAFTDSEACPTCYLKLANDGTCLHCAAGAICRTHAADSLVGLVATLRPELSQPARDVLVDSLAVLLLSTPAPGTDE